MIQAGSIGMLGLGLNHLQAIEALAKPSSGAKRPGSVIFIFLSGGLGQQDSFDMKPRCPGRGAWRVQTDRNSNTWHSNL